MAVAECVRHAPAPRLRTAGPIAQPRADVGRLPIAVRRARASPYQRAVAPPRTRVPAHAPAPPPYHHPKPSRHSPAPAPRTPTHTHSKKSAKAPKKDSGGEKKKGKRKSKETFSTYIHKGLSALGACVSYSAPCPDNATRS